MLFRSTLLSAAVWVALIFAVRGTVVPPESCGEPGAESLSQAAHNAAAWMSRNQLDDGRYAYLYNRDTNTQPDTYNEVRHAGVTMSLYQAAGRIGDPDFIDAADEALVFMQDNMVRRHGWAAFDPNGDDASLGASALMLVSLNERRLGTGDPQYDDLMREVGRFIVALQREDGGFSIAYQMDEDRPDPVGTSRYYPGEATWALALTHEALPGEGWDQYALKGLHYIATKRDDYEDVKLPPLADQWATYSLAEMVEWGLGDDEIEYARSLAHRFGLLVRTESQREGSWYGLFFRGEQARASGVGTWAEALAGLWRVSVHDDRMSDLREPIRERLICVAGILADRQVTPEEAAGSPKPNLVADAWFHEGETRMDDQQHAFSGILYALDALENNPVREPTLGVPRPLQ